MALQRDAGNAAVATLIQRQEAPATSSAPANAPVPAPGRTSGDGLSAPVGHSADDPLAQQLWAGSSGLTVCLSIPDAFDSPQEAAMEQDATEEGEQIRKWLESDSYPWKTLWQGEEHEVNFRKNLLVTMQAQIEKLEAGLAKTTAGAKTAGGKTAADLLSTQLVALRQEKKAAGGLPTAWSKASSSQKGRMRALIRHNPAVRARLYQIAYANNHVFSSGANGFAKEHGASAEESGVLLNGKAMIYKSPEDIPARTRAVHDLALKLLVKNPPAGMSGDSKLLESQAKERAMVRNLALFAHGMPNWLGGHGHAASASFTRGDIPGLVGAMHEALTSDVHVAMFACSGARGPLDESAPPTKGKPTQKEQLLEEFKSLSDQGQALQEALDGLQADADAGTAEAVKLKAMLGAASKAAGGRSRRPAPEVLRLAEIVKKLTKIAAAAKTKQKELAKNAKKVRDNAEWQRWAASPGGGSVAATMLDALASHGHLKSSVMGHMVAGPAISNYKVRFMHAQPEGDRPRTVHEWRPADIFDAPFFRSEALRLMAPSARLTEAGVELAAHEYGGRVGGADVKPRNYGGGEFSEQLNRIIMREAWMLDSSSLAAFQTGCQELMRNWVSVDGDRAKRFVARVAKAAKSKKTPLYK